MALNALNCPIQYVCSCGELRSVYYMYFCRFCLKLECKTCVAQEIDFFYCANCLRTKSANFVDVSNYTFDTVGYLEAKDDTSRKLAWRCANCYDCPRCGSLLSLKATNLVRQSPPSTPTLSGPSTPSTPSSQFAPSDDSPALAKDAGAQPQQRVFYLFCGYCRWTTRDVAMADKPAMKCDWGQRAMPNQQLYNQLVAHYTNLALLDEQATKKKTPSKKRQRDFQFLSSVSKDKLGLMKTVGQHKALHGDTGYLRSLGINDGKSLPPQDEPAATAALACQARADAFEPLPAHLLTIAPDLAAVPTLQQRLADPLLAVPDASHYTCASFIPQPKPLSCKHLQRCFACQHILVRSEDQVIKFKIYGFGVYHVPEVKMVPLDHELVVGRQSRVVLTLTSQLLYPTNIVLLPAEHELAKAQIILPQQELELPGKDVTSDIDELISGAKQKLPVSDCVVFRKANKIAFAVQVVPQETTSNKVTFCIQFNYQTTSALHMIRDTADAKDKTETQRIKLQVIVDIGPAAISLD